MLIVIAALIGSGLSLAMIVFGLWCLSEIRRELHKLNATVSRLAMPVEKAARIAIAESSLERDKATV